MNWYTVIAQFIISLAVFKVYRYCRNRSPINIINGINLPDPNDNRWKLKKITLEDKKSKYWVLQMDNIRLNRNDGNYIGTINIEDVNALTSENSKVQKYINKVFNNYFDKISKRSIQETKFPELEEFHPEA